MEKRRVRQAAPYDFTKVWGYAMGIEFSDYIQCLNEDEHEHQ
jgi:hypothetical protein